MLISSYFFAPGFTAGSASYTPSIDFAERIISASISTALKTVEVSVTLEDGTVLTESFNVPN